MKKSFIILALTLGVSAWSQCHRGDTPSSVNVTFTGGFAKTMTAELAFRFKEYHIGAGAGVMVDNQIRTQDNINYTRNDKAYFVNLGYQQDNIYYGARIGNQTIVHVTGRVNGVNQSIPDDHKIMFGALIGYSVAPRIRINLGYDTFNKANLGVAFGL